MHERLASQGPGGICSSTWSWWRRTPSPCLQYPLEYFMANKQYVYFFQCGIFWEAVCVFLYHFSIHFITIDRIKPSSAMLFLYWSFRSNNWCLCQVRLSSWKGRKTRIEGKYNCISRSSSLLLSLAFTLLPIYSVIYNFSLQAANQLYNFLDLRKYTEVAESIFLQTFRTTFLSLCDIILVILLSFTPKILHLDQFNLSLYSWELVRLWWDKHFSCATKFC
jgi:hypothetical protein